MLVATAGQVSAAVIIFSQMDGSVEGTNFASSTSHWEPGDDFTLSVSSTLESITWTSSSTFPGTSRIRVYADASGTPGAMLYLFDGARVSAGSHPLLGRPLSRVSGMSFAISPGQTYWITTASVTGNQTYYGAQNGSGGNNLHQRLLTDPWTNRFENGQFFLEGTGAAATVPEPTSLAIFGIGAIGMVVRRRRKRKRTA